MTDHLDLLLIEREIAITFELLFDEIPPVDASDRLDGNLLEFFVGKSFHEVPDILENSPADCLSFFSLVELPEAKYYLGGYLLWLLRRVRYSREYYPAYQIPDFLAVSYITLMGFLASEEAVTWIKSCKTLPSLIVRVLDIVVNTAGFMLDEEERKKILQTRALYLPAP